MTTPAQATKKPRNLCISLPHSLANRVNNWLVGTRHQSEEQMLRWKRPNLPLTHRWELGSNSKS